MKFNSEKIQFTKAQLHQIKGGNDESYENDVVCNLDRMVAQTGVSNQITFSLYHPDHTVYDNPLSAKLK